MITWPSSLSRFTRESWFLAGNTPETGGLDGRSQYVVRENRRWTNTVTCSGIWKSRIPAFRSLVHQIRGPANVFRFPICDPYTLKLRGRTEQQFLLDIGISQVDIDNGYLPFATGDTFSNLHGFNLPSSANPTIRDFAAAGSTKIKVAGYLGRRLGVGSFFAIDDFLYEVEATDGDKLTIHPPLRAGVGAGVTMEVNDPYCKVRLASDQDARIFVQFLKFGDPVTFDLVEAFDR